MSLSIKTWINYDRAEKDRLGRTIHIYRKRTYYLSKADAALAREHKEKMKNEEADRLKKIGIG